MGKSENENIEINLFLDSIYHKYGYDFRHYAKASIKRRIQNFLQKTNYKRISEMIPALLYDKKFFESLVYDFSITVTEMFRDPVFFKSLKENIFPYLKTYPYFKIWHVGCATGEEVYSLAILLKEEGLYDRATIFATDFNEAAIRKAKEGIYPLDNIKKYTTNYLKAGGNNSFSDYYHAQYKSAIFNNGLRKNITFANHNLSTDSSFGEMNLILCRNVLIYFDKTLQSRVLYLLNESLSNQGFLALGSKETLLFSKIENKLKLVKGESKIYQKK